VLWIGSSKRLIQLNPSDLVLNLDSQDFCTVTPTKSAHGALQWSVNYSGFVTAAACFACRFMLFLAVFLYVRSDQNWDHQDINSGHQTSCSFWDRPPTAVRRLIGWKLQNAKFFHPLSQGAPHRMFRLEVRGKGI